MKIPRDIGANDLIKALKEYGYTITRQTGSHIRLSTKQNGEHHITIPHHNPLKVGTLNAILVEVCTIPAFQKNRSSLDCADVNTSLKIHLSLQAPGLSDWSIHRCHQD